MNNRRGRYYKISERIELSDILKRKDIPMKRTLSGEEMKELERYLARKVLIVLDKDPDSYKEEK